MMNKKLRLISSDKLISDEPFVDSETILEAARFAEHAHRGQFRKWGHSNVPYITHPARVSGMVCVLPNSTVEMVVAAWVHDVLEDTSHTVEDLIIRLGSKVAGLVVELTNTSKETGAPRDVRKRLDHERLSKVSEEAKLIKLCDRIDNMQETYEANAPHDFLKKYRKESLDLLENALKGTDKVLELKLRVLAE